LKPLKSAGLGDDVRLRGEGIVGSGVPTSQTAPGYITGVSKVLTVNR
jgi:hypothetical protein